MIRVLEAETKAAKLFVCIKCNAMPGEPCHAISHWNAGPRNVRPHVERLICAEFEYTPPFPFCDAPKGGGHD